MKAATAVIALLAEHWPKCFHVYEQRRKPLKVGIREDVLAALGGEVTRSSLSRALRVYVSNKSYRSRLVAGAVRVGLDGEPAGVVTAEEAAQAVASAKVSIARGARGANPAKPSPPPPAPKRLGLADLRAAAQRRREMETST